MLADFDTGIKICSRCKVSKDLSEYHKNRSHQDGMAHNCKACASAIQKTNPQKRNTIERAAYMKEYLRKKKYGMTNDEVNALLLAQDSSCAICKKNLGEVFDIDHNHSTGAVRGLLCRSCNMALGIFQDDPNILTEAVCYLYRDSFDLRNEKMKFYA